MNKTLLVTSLVVVGVALAGASAMLVTDRQIDAALAQLQDSAAASSILIAVSDDQSSFIERHLVLTASVEQADQRVTLVIDNNIQKRPWGARIEHRLHFDASLLTWVDDAQNQALLRTLLIDQDVMTGTTKIGLTGDYQSDWLGIGIEEQIEQATVRVSPLRLAITGDPSGKFSMTGSWPGATVTVDEPEQVAMVMRPLSFQSEGRYIGGSVFVGEQSTSGDGMSFDLTSELAQVHYQVGAYSIQSNSQVTDERLAMDLSFQVDQVSLDDGEAPVDIKDILLALSMTGSSVQNLQSLSQNLNAMQISGEASPALMEDINVFLRTGFVFAVSQLQATLDGQAIALQASFEMPENAVADVNNPFSMLSLVSSLKADAHLELAGGLSESTLLAEPFNNLMMTGVLVENGADYQVDFKLADGSALLNGEPLPLPF